MSISGFSAENFLKNLEAAGNNAVITADEEGNLAIGNRGSKFKGKAKKLVENIENVKKQFDEVIRYIKENKEKTREQKRNIIINIDSILKNNLDHLWEKTHNKRWVKTKNIDAYRQLNELKNKLVKRYNKEML